MLSKHPAIEGAGVDAQALGHQVAEASRVQVGAAADDPVLRQSAQLPGDVGQNVHWGEEDEEDTKSKYTQHLGEEEDEVKKKKKTQSQNTHNHTHTRARKDAPGLETTISVQSGLCFTI